MCNCEDFKLKKEDMSNARYYVNCSSKAKYKIQLEKGMLLNGNMTINVCGVHKNSWETKLKRHNKKINISNI